MKSTTHQKYLPQKNTHQKSYIFFPGHILNKDFQKFLFVGLKVDMSVSLCIRSPVTSRCHYVILFYFSLFLMNKTCQATPRGCHPNKSKLCKNLTKLQNPKRENCSKNSRKWKNLYGYIPNQNKLHKKVKLFPFKNNRTSCVVGYEHSLYRIY